MQCSAGLRAGREWRARRKSCVVLSYPFWQRRYHGDMHVLGKALKLGSTSFTVIGVAPPEFTGTGLNPQVPDLWAPVSMQEELVPGQDWLHKPTDFEFQILARLDPGVAMKQAEAETDALVRQFAATYTWRDHTLAVAMERTAFFGNTNDPRFRAGVGAVMVIFALVLLVACANVTNMLVARGAARQKEISIRLALGASRARVVRHLLTESMLLALGGGVVGLALAAASGKLLSDRARPDIGAAAWQRFCSQPETQSRCSRADLCSGIVARHGIHLWAVARAAVYEARSEYFAQR